MNFEFVKGQEFELKDIKVYPRYCSNKTDIIKSGTYYIWDTSIKNNKIRITKNPKGAGILGQITGWIDILDLLQDPNEFRIGDKVIVNGDISTYPDGTGNIIHRKDAIMYIVNLEIKETYSNYIGVSNAKNRIKLGFASEKMIQKINE